MKPILSSEQKTKIKDKANKFWIWCQLTFKKVSAVLLVAFKWLMIKMKGHPPLKLDVPSDQPASAKPKVKPGVALVLSGGAGRIAAHFGAISVLNEHNIPVSLVIGTSAGAIAGSIFCDNPDQDFKALVQSLKKKDLFDCNLWSTMKMAWRLSGFSEGHALQQYLSNNLKSQNFSDFEIPLAVATTDITLGETYMILQGPIAPAVNASCAIPVQFAPVKLYGRTLIDGGIICPLNIDKAYELGATKTITIDLNTVDNSEVKSNLDLQRKSTWLTLKGLSKQTHSKTNIVIQPKFDSLRIFNDKDLEAHYQAGVDATLELIDDIKAFVKG